jgi:hypothetical protein
MSKHAWRSPTRHATASVGIKPHTIDARMHVLNALLIYVHDHRRAHQGSLAQPPHPLSNRLWYEMTTQQISWRPSQRWPKCADPQPGEGGQIGIRGVLMHAQTRCVMGGWLTGRARHDEGVHPLGEVKASEGTAPTLSSHDRAFLRARPSSSSEDVDRRGGAPRDTTPNASSLLL